MVSILIPVFNRADFISKAIQSAQTQTFSDIEIIVVDNKSDDGTWEILLSIAKSDDRIKIFQNETNIGPVKNWERCIDEASGEFGKILWSDDLIAPDYIEKTVSFIKDDKDVGFVFTKTEIFQEGTEKRNILYDIAETGVYDCEYYINGVLFSNRYPVSPGCAIFRLDDLKNNLLINIPNKVKSDFSQHAIGNDLLVFLLTANQYKKFAFVNEKLAFFRSHNNSISVITNNGYLSQQYNIAKTFFVENYRKDLIKKMNGVLCIDLIRNLGNNVTHICKIDDFYISNKEFGIDIIYLIVLIIRKIINRIKIKI